MSYRSKRSLIALNALILARDAEAAIASKTIDIRSSQAEDLIWQFTKYKALAVALNPIAVLDVGGTKYNFVSFTAGIIFIGLAVQNLGIQTTALFFEYTYNP